MYSEIPHTPEESEKQNTRRTSHSSADQPSFSDISGTHKQFQNAQRFIDIQFSSEDLNLHARNALGTILARSSSGLPEALNLREEAEPENPDELSEQKTREEQRRQWYQNHPPIGNLPRSSHPLEPPSHVSTDIHPYQNQLQLEGHQGAIIIPADSSEDITPELTHRQAIPYSQRPGREDVQEIDRILRDFERAIEKDPLEGLIDVEAIQRDISKPCRDISTLVRAVDPLPPFTPKITTRPAN